MEPSIVCPNCKTEVKLTETLAAPLIEAVRRDADAKMRQKEREIAKREEAIRQQQDAVTQAREAMEAEVTERMKAERKKVAEEEAKKARAAFSLDLHQKAQQLEELTKAFNEREAKLAEAQKAQAGAVRKERELAEARRELDLTVEKRVLEKQAEISKRAEEEAKKARAAFSVELHHKAQQLEELTKAFNEREAKLAEAQKAQAEAVRKERELAEARRELDLTIEKRVAEKQGEILSRAKQEAEQALGLKVQEKEQTILGMQKQIEDLKRRAEQGSQQLQGEVQELQLEALLRASFPHDAIQPVPKGEFGGDTIQQVTAPSGQPCGKILWESKRTRNWSDGWLQKLRDDQRAAKADAAILVSQALPKSIDVFGQIDGVWITAPKCAAAVAMAIRHAMIEVTMARKSGEGQQTKMEAMYHYLTGPRFRHRVEAIVEKFTDMQADLEKERRAMQKSWAKREVQIQGIIEATSGMWGDMQGIAGQSLKEIEGLDFDGAAVEELPNGGGVRMIEFWCITPNPAECFGKGPLTSALSREGRGSSGVPVEMWHPTLSPCGRGWPQSGRVRGAS